MGLAVTLTLVIATYAIFAIFMIAQKYATLRSNLRFFTGLTVISFVMRIVSEFVIDITVKI